MANPMTEPLEPYEPSTTYGSQEQEYDWDYDEARSEHRPMNILWGRVAILGAIVLLAFLLGRMTSGSGGADASQLTAANERVAELEQQNGVLTTESAAKDDQIADLQSQIAALETAGTTTGTDNTAAPSEGDQITGTKYTVESGDTLQSIAEEFYGDASLDDYLAEINNITDPTALGVGQELIIPDDPPAE
jgi:nucleoid-associated protein YgaU